MKYRATDTVHWPDGTIRARAGELFDGFDSEDAHPVARAAARRWLRGFHGKYVPEVTDAECDAVGNEIPDELFDHVRREIDAAGLSITTRAEDPSRASTTAVPERPHLDPDAD